ncbi:MAG TPA: hypothetical protein VGB26_12145, partial [Nitrospiria bacterium]
MIFQRFTIFGFILIFFCLSFEGLVQGAPGDLDTTFDPVGLDGKVSTDFSGGNDVAYAVAIQPDGKILVAGSAGLGNLDFALVRYNSNGSLDTTFDPVGLDGKVSTDFSGGNDVAYAVAIQPDGKILAAGSAGLGNLDFGLARYDNDGSHDEVFSNLIQADGKIVVAGRTGVNGFYDFALARYDTDGSLDGTFGSSGKVSTGFNSNHDEAYAMAIQA